MTPTARATIAWDRAMTGNGNQPTSGIDHAEIRFLVEKNADGIIVVDDSGIVLFANPAAEQIFGRPFRSLIGYPIGIPITVGDTTEITIHKPGGNQIDAEIRVVDTTWNDKPARLATLRDISARRVIEERLRHSAKMEAIGRLTAGIAHDFNNLLMVVLGNLETAQRHAKAAEPALQRPLDNATRGARRAAGLTEKLLAFARRKPLDPKVVDVNAIVAGMSELLQRTLGEGISVRTVLVDRPWPMDVDPTEFEAAILNLAVNARDAMPAGGQLVIETANAEIGPTDADVKEGHYILVTIADSGTGMTPDVLKQVFEPFFTTKGGRGTGLGLSQVYGFVTQSGGYVRMESETGKGTTAKLYFPKAVESRVLAGLEMHESRSVVEVPRSQSGESILVVEDDEDVRQHTVSSLQELGYTVFEAVDAASASKIFEEQSKIDLLFTDLGLPGGTDGRELSERVRILRPSLKVLITTAYAASALIHDGRLDAGVELLSKPFTFEALAGRIRNVLDRGRVQENPGRILVVEDEALLRMFVAETLSDWGFQVEEAGNFHEGLDKFRKFGDSLQAAIVDLGLPDKPGDQLIREIRAVRGDLPIVLATGYASQVFCDRIAADPLLQILDKPFEPAGMAAVLRRLNVPVSGRRE